MQSLLTTKLIFKIKHKPLGYEGDGTKNASTADSPDVVRNLDKFRVLNKLVDVD